MSILALSVQAQAKSNPQPSVSHLRHMPAPENVMEEALRVGETGHARWQLKALYDATENGAIAWVSVEYLKSISDGGGFLPRRQDVPRDAFLTVEEVKNQALFVLTYRWLEREHPDPKGFRLKQLFEVLKKENAHPRDGVFWDWTALYQRPRTDDQDELFKMGLKASIQVFSSFRVGCIVLPEVPVDYTPYWQSGWCYADFLLSSLCSRIVTAKEPSVSAHLVPEWLVGWRERLRDSMLFAQKSDVRQVERLIARWAADLPTASTDAVGFVVACAVANYRFVRCWFLRELAARGGPSPRRQDLPDDSYVDGHVPAGQQLWVVSYPWSAQTHPSPGGEKIRELVGELNNQGASDDDVVFLDHMSLWQGAENVPEVYAKLNKVTGAKSADEGLVSLPDRTEEQLKEFKFALFETTRLYAFAGGNLPDGTDVKGCRVLVLPGLDNYEDFPDRGECVEMLNTHCEPPRREMKMKWVFRRV